MTTDFPFLPEPQLPSDDQSPYFEADSTLFLQLTHEEALMVSTGLVQLGMDSGLMWELGTDVEQVTALANKIRECSSVQGFLP